MLGRAMMAAGWHVAADHLANRLGLFPADIAFMSVRHERQPIGTCLPPRLHTGDAVACRHGRLTISIGATSPTNGLRSAVRSLRTGPSCPTGINQISS